VPCSTDNRGIISPINLPLLSPSPVTSLPSTQGLLSEFYGVPSIKPAKQKRKKLKNCKEQVVDQVTSDLGTNELTEMDPRGERNWLVCEPCVLHAAHLTPLQKYAPS